MKTKLFSLLAAMMLLTTPVSFTSCSDDETTQELLNLALNLLLGGTDELNGTNWVSENQDQQFYFSSTGGSLYFYLDSQGQAQQRQFTYAVGEDGSTITVTWADDSSTTVYVITAYEASNYLQLKDSATGTETLFHYQAGD